MAIKERIKSLRVLMEREGISAYYVGLGDPHGSEYISDHYKSLHWISGFTGSAGYLLVGLEEALLWVDGRYFIQAERQLKGSGIQMMKTATSGYPDIFEWISNNIPAEEKIGVCGRLVTQDFFEELKSKVGHEVVIVTDLIDEIWDERPALPETPIWLHNLEYTGKTASEKIQDVRELMEKDRVDAFVLSGLDDIAWLFNIRGNDVPFNPVVLSFAFITKDEVKFFLDKNKVGKGIEEELEAQGIQIFAYEDIYSYLKTASCRRVAVNKEKVNAELFAALNEEAEVCKLETDYTTVLKTVLNETELACTKNAALKDSVAFTKFIYWLKQAVQKEAHDELSVEKKLHEFRKEQDLFLDDSFATISAYGPNAAMMHYRATEKSYSELEAKGFYLNDSGGHYLDGTTDVTRTIALGELSEREIRDYTLTVKSHIGLADTVFLEGASGIALDIKARQPMWDAGLDYKCGTGHSVGYLLGVHEGPIRFAKDKTQYVLKENMFVTIEPGVYIEGEYGIRVENDYVVVHKETIDSDVFLAFESLTFVPFEREAIDVSLLTEKELAWVNRYQQEVYAKCSPFLNEAERTWLAAVTEPFTA